MSIEKGPNVADITRTLDKFREVKIAYQKWRKETPLMEQFVSDFEGILEYHRLLNDLEQVAIYADSVVVADRQLQQLFNRIRVEALDDIVSDDGSISCDDLFWNLSDKYHPNKYAIELKKVRPLVMLHHVPARVASLFKEAREAYCLGLHAATISLCRSLIECCMLDILERSGRIGSDYDIANSGIADRVELLFGRRKNKGDHIQCRVCKLISETSEVIHANRAAEPAEAFEILRETANLSQALYSRFGDGFDHPSPDSDK